MLGQSNERSYYEHLCGIMLKTSRARFFAAKSLKAKDRFSVIVSVLLSIALISLSLSQITGLPVSINEYNKEVSALSIIAAIGLLSQTLIDWSLGRTVLAEKLHDNALQITRNLREIERKLLKSDPDFSKISTVASRYEDANVLTGVNHSDWDYLMSTRHDRNECWLKTLTRDSYQKSIQRISILFASMLGLSSLILVVVGTIYFLL